MRQHLGALMFGAIERQTAALNQHPAADDVVNHQQQEPNSNRGFQTRQQRLRGGQVAHRRGENRQQRRANHQVPQQQVDTVLAAAAFIEIQRDTGAFQAKRHHCQRPANQDEAEPAERRGEFPIVEIIEHD